MDVNFILDRVENDCKVLVSNERTPRSKDNILSSVETWEMFPFIFSLFRLFSLIFTRFRLMGPILKSRRGAQSRSRTLRGMLGTKAIRGDLHAKSPLKQIPPQTTGILWA